MILAFSDFGLEGPYTGEMRIAALREAPAVTYVDLMADAPVCRPDLAAYLLAAVARRLQWGDVVLAVVDPGVGSGRLPLAVEVDGVWFVGPDNGLFELVLRRGSEVRAFAIGWRPAALSTSFHGRDLFAPTAARLASGKEAGLVSAEPRRFSHWPDDLDAVVHVDRFGNLVAGRRSASLDNVAEIRLGRRHVRLVRTFSDVRSGELLAYENSMGLLEIALNGGSAAARLDLSVGAALELHPAGHRST